MIWTSCLRNTAWILPKISVLRYVGEFNEENQFVFDYYFPYSRGTQISSYEDISIERHAEKESYAGICDDIKVGVSLIFYLQM